jgi:hypothetical protein
VVFVARSKSKGKPVASDDALEVGIFDADSLPKELAFDHSRILKDYFRRLAAPRP